MMMAYNPNEDIHERHAQYVADQNKIKDQFLSYLDFNIGMAISNENGVRAAAFVEVREKYSSLLNNQKNESKG